MILQHRAYQHLFAKALHFLIYRKMFVDCDWPIPVQGNPKKSSAKICYHSAKICYHVLGTNKIEPVYPIYY